tara:strand:+ start:97 stop:606 length:510 start_codon:yes stop_codon:yes gene_type:complete
MSGIINQTGSRSGIAGTFPTKVTDRTDWYKLFSGNSSSNVSDWPTSDDLDEGQIRCSGCAPVGFTSIVGMEAWFLSAASNPGAMTVTFEWEIAHHTSNYNEHGKEVTGMSVSSDFGSTKVHKLDILNAANDGADFEDVIAENDVFGIRFHGSNTSAFVTGLGVKITWRF